MGIKKHTPWFLEFHENSYRNSPSIGVFKNPASLAIFHMYNAKVICQKHGIWYKQQNTNMTKKHLPDINRLYFKSETDRNTVLLLQ